MQSQTPPPDGTPPPVFVVSERVYSPDRTVPPNHLIWRALPCGHFIHVGDPLPEFCPRCLDTVRDLEAYVEVEPLAFRPPLRAALIYFRRQATTRVDGSRDVSGPPVASSLDAEAASAA